MKRHSLVAYFVLTFGITWGIAALLIAFPTQFRAWFGEMKLTNPLFLLAVWSPNIAATIVTGATQGRRGLARLYARFFRWQVGLRWYLFILLGFPALNYIAVLVAGGPAGIDPIRWLLPIPAMLALLYSGALGEELGWRGFALPRLLERRGALAASLILGAVWTLWHLPAFFLSGTPQAGLSLPAFVAAGLAISVLATWLFNHTGGSVLLSILFHFMANLVQNATPAPWPVWAAVLAVAAVGVILVDGPRHLARTGPAVSAV